MTTYVGAPEPAFKAKDQKPAFEYDLTAYPQALRKAILRTIKREGETVLVELQQFLVEWEGERVPLDAPDHILKGIAKRIVGRPWADFLNAHKRHITKPSPEAAAAFQKAQADYREDTATPFCREKDWRWHRRQMRALIRAGYLFLSHRVSAVEIAPVDLVRRRDEQQRRNASVLRETHISDGEQTLTLWDVSQRSKANPKVRKADMLVRLWGMAKWAIAQGYQPMFVTITLPSRFHNGSQKWDKTDAAAAVEWANGKWSRYRQAERHRLEVGFIVLEPHRDGTPHFHALIFTQDPEAVKETLTDLYLRGRDCDGDEKGAAENRLTFEVLGENAADGDPAARMGMVISYVSKYVSKHVANAGEIQDIADGMQGMSVSEYQAKVSTWLSAIRKRQFRFFGLPLATLWTECHRLDRPACPTLRTAAEATRPDAALATEERPSGSVDFARFIHATVAEWRHPETGKVRRMKVLRIMREADLDGQPRFNRYNEEIKGKVKGVASLRIETQAVTKTDRRKSGAERRRVIYKPVPIVVQTQITRLKDWNTCAAPSRHGLDLTPEHAAENPQPAAAPGEGVIKVILRGPSDAGDPPAFPRLRLIEQAKNTAAEARRARRSRQQERQKTRREAQQEAHRWTAWAGKARRHAKALDALQIDADRRRNLWKHPPPLPPKKSASGPAFAAKTAA